MTSILPPPRDAIGVVPCDGDTVCVPSPSIRFRPLGWCAVGGVACEVSVEPAVCGTSGRVAHPDAVDVCEPIQSSSVVFPSVPVLVFSDTLGALTLGSAVGLRREHVG
jgi:hypothetical protein